MFYVTLTNPLVTNGTTASSGGNPRAVVSYKPTDNLMFFAQAARGFRYGIEGIIAVRYGDAVLLFLTAHKTAFALSVLAVLFVLYLINRLIFRTSEPIS